MSYGFHKKGSFPQAKKVSGTLRVPMADEGWLGHSEAVPHSEPQHVGWALPTEPRRAVVGSAHPTKIHKLGVCRILSPRWVPLALPVLLAVVPWRRQRPRPGTIPTGTICCLHDKRPQPFTRRARSGAPRRR